MSKEDKIIIGLFVSVIGIVIMAFIIGKRSVDRTENEIYWENKTKEITIKDSLKEANYLKVQDSLKVYYSGMEKAIQSTQYSINKLIKSNNEKKNQLMFINDSTKLYIIDSILRSNGYRN